MQRAQPLRAARLRHVERVAEPVVVPVDLARGRRRELDVTVGAAEAPGPIRLDVDLALPGDDQLCNRLADPAGAAEAVQRQAGRQPEPGNPGDGPQQGVAVGRHRVRMPYERHDPGILEKREAPDGAVHQLGEPLVIRSNGAALVLPGNAVRPPRHRVGLVAAEHDSA